MSIWRSRVSIPSLYDFPAPQISQLNSWAMMSPDSNEQAYKISLIDLSKTTLGTDPVAYLNVKYAQLGFSDEVPVVGNLTKVPALDRYLEVTELEDYNNIKIGSSIIFQDGPITYKLGVVAKLGARKIIVSPNITDLTGHIYDWQLYEPWFVVPSNVTASGEEWALFTISEGGLFVAWKEDILVVPTPSTDQVFADSLIIESLEVDGLKKIIDNKNSIVFEAPASFSGLCSRNVPVEEEKTKCSDLRSSGNVLSENKLNAYRFYNETTEAYSFRVDDFLGQPQVQFPANTYPVSYTSLTFGGTDNKGVISSTSPVYGVEFPNTTYRCGSIEYSSVSKKWTNNYKGAFFIFSGYVSLFNYIDNIGSDGTVIPRGTILNFTLEQYDHLGLFVDTKRFFTYPLEYNIGTGGHKGLSDYISLEFNTSFIWNQGYSVKMSLDINGVAGIKFQDKPIASANQKPWSYFTINYLKTSEHL